jgi:hypothetical protein
MSSANEVDYQVLVKHQDIAIDPFISQEQPAPESLQALLDAYNNDVKQKR